LLFVKKINKKYSDIFRSHQNFGVLGILDALHGTDQEWRKSRSGERHFYLFGFSSSREILNSKEKRAE
jgi:fatty acid hydroxylase domain-containing protein 2